MLTASHGVVVTRPPMAEQVANVVEDANGVVANQVVAAFEVPNNTDGAGWFQASINWGDGATSAGVISGSNGLFQVAGGHTYALLGNHVMQVTVSQQWFLSDPITSMSGKVTIRLPSWYNQKDYAFIKIKAGGTLGVPAKTIDVTVKKVSLLGTAAYQVRELNRLGAAVKNAYEQTYLAWKGVDDLVTGALTPADVKKIRTQINRWFAGKRSDEGKWLSASEVLKIRTVLKNIYVGLETLKYTVCSDTSPVALNHGRNTGAFTLYAPYFTKSPQYQASIIVHEASHNFGSTTDGPYAWWTPPYTDFTYYENDNDNVFGTEAPNFEVEKAGGATTTGNHPAKSILLNLADAYEGYVRQYYLRPISNDPPAHYAFQ